VALPAYLHDTLGELLWDVFRDKIVVLLCERFLNSGAFLNSLIKSKAGLPRVLLTHKSEPIDATKNGFEGECRIWRLKKSADVSVVLGHYKPAVKFCHDLWCLPEKALRIGTPLLHVAFQNLNSIGHACVDLKALRLDSYILGQPHYTPKTYTEDVVQRILLVAEESNSISKAVANFMPKSLAEHDLTSYSGGRLDEIAGTARFRLESSIAKHRLAPPRFRASGYEDAGWSLVPLEQLGRFIDIKTPNLTRLIDEWCMLTGVQYRRLGRNFIKTLEALIVSIDTPDFCRFIGMRPSVFDRIIESSREG